MTISGVYQFIGPTAVINLAASSKVIGSATAIVGKLAAGNETLDYALCYQQGATLSNLAGNFNYLSLPLQPNVMSQIAVSSTGTLGAGTFTVGVCAKTGGAGFALNLNDWVTGWFIVSP